MEQRQLYEVTGLVKSVDKYEPNAPKRFRVQTEKNVYIMQCDFFCPLHEGDIIKALVFKDEVGPHYHLYRQPFVQIPMDEDSIKRCFIMALRGTGFGSVSADMLYKQLASMAKQGGYCPEQRVEAAIEEVVVEEKKDIPGIPKAIRNKQVKLTELTLGEDGVMGFLSEFSVEFSRGNWLDYIDVITSSTSVTGEQVKALLKWWHKNCSLRRLYLLGLNNKEIKESRLSHDQIYEICIDNPLRLPSVPLEKAINIMNSLNKQVTDTDVECGKIVRTINDYINRYAWTCVPGPVLKKQLPMFWWHKEILENWDVHVDLNAAYLPYQLLVETEVAKYIDSLIMKSSQIYTLPTTDTPKIESAFYSCKTLTPEQKIAIQGALNSHISIITGGPGTGKTTTIKEICRNLNIRDIPLQLASFTGKAVVRMDEIMGDKVAATMDRLIFQASNVKPFKHLIIDEVSMVTTELFYRFISTYTDEYKITLIGDVDQLQPIGWGSFFHQLLSCGRIPVYRLTLNQRIVTHSLEDGRPQSIDGEPAKADFDRCILTNMQMLIDEHRSLEFPMEFVDGSGFYKFEGTIDHVHDILTGIYQSGADKKDVVVITPYNEFLTPINTMFQNIFLDTNNSYMDRKKRRWCLGDRVMMCKNNYDIGIMNGEEGDIVELSHEGVTVRFKDCTQHLFKYSKANDDNEYRSWKKGGTDAAIGEAIEEWNDGELTVDCIQQSFAITAHKSQGSEYEYVVVYIPPKRNERGDVSSFLNLNLLYVIISRAKRAVWLVGCMHTLARITCKKAPGRADNLGLRLKKMKTDEDQKMMDLLIEERSRVDNEIKSEYGDVGKITIHATNPFEDDGMPEHDDFDYSQLDE